MNTLSLYVQRNEEVISADSRSLISKRYCTVTSAMNREFWNITSDRQIVYMLAPMEGELR